MAIKELLTLEGDRPNTSNQATWPRNTRKDADSMAAASFGDGLAHPLAPSALKNWKRRSRPWLRPGTAPANVTESIIIARASRTRVYCGSCEEELLGKYYKARDQLRLF